MATTENHREKNFRNRSPEERDDVNSKILRRTLEKAIVPPKNAKVKGNTDDIVADTVTLRRIRGDVKQGRKYAEWVKQYRGVSNCSYDDAVKEALIALSELGYFLHGEGADGKEHFIVNPYAKELMGIL